MIPWGLSEVEVLACFFIASAALILVGLRMIIGPSPQRIRAGEHAIETLCPRRITAVEDEGYQIVELYNDSCALDDWLRGATQSTAILSGDAVRTAKVRNPESGEIRLIRVLDRAGRFQ